jgi:hypothetical protein
MAEIFPCDVQGNCCTWQSTWSLYVLLYLIVSMSQSCIVSYVVCMGFLQSPPEARLWAGLQSEWSLQLASYNPRFQWACQMCFVWHYPTKVVRMECASITGNSHVFKVLCTLEDLLLVLEVPLGWRILSKLFGINCQGFFPHYPAWLQTLICGVHDLGAWSWSIDIRHWCRLSIDLCSVIVLKLLRMMK